MGAFFSGLRGRETVKTGKSTGKTFRAFISVFERGIQHFGACRQFAARQRQPAQTNIFRGRMAK